KYHTFLASCITVKQIQKWNKLRSTVLSVGKMLKIY
ncbi:MAG: LysM peptidoglycan-binding domain-containing protein, partial [Mucinivorans sp.]